MHTRTQNSKQSSSAHQQQLSSGPQIQEHKSGLAGKWGLRKWSEWKAEEAGWERGEDSVKKKDSSEKTGKKHKKEVEQSIRKEWRGERMEQWNWGKGREEQVSIWLRERIK